MKDRNIKDRAREFVISLNLPGQEQVLRSIEQSDRKFAREILFSFPIRSLKFLKKLERKMEQFGLFPHSTAIFFGIQHKPCLYTDIEQNFITLKYDLHLNSWYRKRFITNNPEVMRGLERIRKFFSVFDVDHFSFFKSFYIHSDKKLVVLDLTPTYGEVSEGFDLLMYNFLIRFFNHAYKRRMLNILLPKMRKVLEITVDPLIIEAVTRI